MNQKKKSCKGINKAKNFEGCGEEVFNRTYGLCRECLKEWARTTPEGWEYVQSRVIPKAKKKVRQKKAKEKKQYYEKLKTHKDYLKDLQKEFNKFIRLRDKGKPCVSCGKPDKGKRDASHYFSVGSTPNLRFDEDNVHASCVRCNRDLHGNISEYTIRLPERIGKKRFKELQQRRNTINKPTIPEIKELIKIYKDKARTLIK